tara:strand:+ start:708 stop:2456 length:1749 start_codon:yes stop_codon:yes gene_type:complete
MKKISYLLILIFAFGCADLDLQPTDMIAEDAVKKDPKLVEAFLTKIYHNVNWEPNSQVGQRDGNKTAWKHWRFADGTMGGEYTLMAPWQEGVKASETIPTSSGARASMNYWPYGNIRSCNEIIDILAAASFDATTVKTQTAEAKFLRAFMYLEMAKRYGGVPLELKPQQLDASSEELYMPRATLKATFDQIISDLNIAIADLPGTAMSGKATKWAAHALKSRAALYAARIAKYHPQSSDGLTSIPSGSAGGYYTASLASANAVIDGGKHPLYKGGANAEHTFSEILTKKGNSEMIMVEAYDLGLGKTHGWGYFEMPDGFKSGWGSNVHIYEHSTERFEYQDGTPGNKNRNLFNGNTFFDIEEVVYKKDPRYLAKVWTPEEIYDGREVWFHDRAVGSGTFKGRAGGVAPNRAPTRNRNRGGRLGQSRVPLDGSYAFIPGDADDSDYVIFRTGEMYLNASEAAFELGKMDQAKGRLNAIRARVGMPAKTTVTLDVIKNERFVELFMENHHLWDLKTWRDAEAVIHMKKKVGVKWTRRKSDGMYSAKRWDWNFSKNTAFIPKMYWLPIGTAKLADNPNLVENPGY